MTIDEAEKIKNIIENKDYIIQLVKTMIESFKNLKIEDVNMFQLGYNKAIDDYLLIIISNCSNFRTNRCYSNLYDAIELLKAGEKNE